MSTRDVLAKAAKTKSVLAKAVACTLTALLLSSSWTACTRTAPVAVVIPSSTATIDQPAEPIIGITESISEGPVLDAPSDVLKPIARDHPLYLTPITELRIDSLIAAMTLEEKAGQMNQYTSFYDVTGPAPTSGTAQERFEQVRKGLVGSMLNVTGAANTRKIQELAMQSRLRIPLLFGYDVIHGFKTQFPIPLAEAATWNLSMIEQAARYAAIEATAFGQHWTFAPMVDVSPDARWGRVMEGAGEDPYLGSLIAVARVRGFQGTSLLDNNTMAACVKHFAGYGFASGGRDYNTADVSDYTLYNEILPPFQAAAEAGAATFMNGFNSNAGVPVTADRRLQQEWLKGDLSFPGFVVSDWNSIGELVPQGAAADLREAAKLSVLAGSDMDMETATYVTSLPALVRAGQVPEARLDDAVRRILRVKFALGLFEDPYKYCDPAREAAVGKDPAVRAAAIATAAASAVLLKNDRQLLPLDPQSKQRILVIGDLATDRNSPLGNWLAAAEPNSAVPLLGAIRQTVSDSSRISHQLGVRTLEANSPYTFAFELKVNMTDRSSIAAAVAAAKRADVVILVLGEPGLMSGEGRSRANISLPGLQQELADQVIAANPNTAVVLYSGRPLEIKAMAQKAPAILLAWQPGTYGNLGIAELLFGKRSPSGKLPVSFPHALGQLPLNYRDYTTGRPSNEGMVKQGLVFHSHYMDVPNGALFAFGHGLSYTSFELGKATLSQNLLSTGGDLVVSTTIKNTGTRPGTETVQLYLNDPVASRVRPGKELKGFAQVSLAPGESKSVEIRLSPKQLAFWTPEAGWHLEAGKIRLWTGTSSAQLGEMLEVDVPESLGDTKP